MSTQVRERVSRTEARSTKTSRMPLGLSAGEMIAAVMAFALLVWLIVAYFTSLRPQHERLRSLETELAAQQRSILGASVVTGGDQPNPSDQARDAIESLETFKTGHLKHFSSGRIELIKEINALAKKNNVVLTSGIDMTANIVESADANKPGGKTDKKGTSTRKKADEILSAFPSVNFRFTVLGQYASLRNFISEIEREKQFLVINSVNLTNQEGKTSGRRSRGEGGVSGIMLTIEMSAYFQPM